MTAIPTAVNFHNTEAGQVQEGNWQKVDKMLDNLFKINY